MTHEPDALTDHDRELLAMLLDLGANVKTDPMSFLNALYAYYHDPDRADRTPRHVLYFHLGILSGALLDGREKVA